MPFVLYALYAGCIDKVSPVQYSQGVTNPLAEWLRAAREQQVDPETGKAWSQARAAKVITAKTGKTLYREALNGYENGKGMEPETYDRLVGFWADYGVTEAPALNEKAKEEPSLEERAVIAAEAQVKAIKALADELLAWRTEDRVELKALRTAVTQLLGERDPSQSTDATQREPLAPGQ